MTKSLAAAAAAATSICCRCWFSLSRSWMKKRDHSASPSTGQRFRQCLTPHPRATVQPEVTMSQRGSFPYAGSLIHFNGDSAPEVKHRVSITRDVYDGCVWQHLARSCVSVGTKLSLYITLAFCQSFCMVRRLGL